MYWTGYVSMCLCSKRVKKGKIILKMQNNTKKKFAVKYIGLANSLISLATRLAVVSFDTMSYYLTTAAKVKIHADQNDGVTSPPPPPPGIIGAFACPDVLEGREFVVKKI